MTIVFKSNAQNFAVNSISDAISYMQGKIFYNETQDAELEFKYISELNTYGIVLKSNKSGRQINFINCDVNGYGSYSDISGISPNDGSAFKFRLYESKIVVGVGEQRMAIFYPQQNSTKSENLTDPNYYIGTWVTNDIVRKEKQTNGKDKYVPTGEIMIEIKKENGKLKAILYKDNKIFNIKTKCGNVSFLPISNRSGMRNYSTGENFYNLVFQGCTEFVHFGTSYGKSIEISNHNGSERGIVLYINITDEKGIEYSASNGKLKRIK
jgi:hypothetical protein